MIGGKMYLFSIPQLHKAIQATPIYQDKRPTEKKVFIDKCNWLIHSIVQQNRRKQDSLFDYKPVPLQKTILKKMLGTTEYLTITRLLNQLEFIVIDHNYTPTSFINFCNANRLAEGKQPLKTKPESKKYALTDKALAEGVDKVGILTARMRVKIRKYKAEKIKKYSTSTVHSKILNSITKVEFNPKHNKALETLKEHSDTTTDKGKYYNEVYQELQDLNKCNTVNDLATNDNFYYTQSSNVNRVFHYYSTIPKPFRESLKLKSGGSLSEIDLRNSQPLIIALNYLNSNERNLNKSNDYDLLHDVLSGSFYKAVANQAKKNNDTEIAELYTTNYSKFKAKVLGQGLYFNYIPHLDKIKPMERYLMELYPNFMQYIRDKKRKRGYKIVSIEAQLIESSIFIDRLYNQLTNEDIAIPVHDSIIVPKEHEQYYLNKLEVIFKTIFPFIPIEQIKPLFRITEY